MNGTNSATTSIPPSLNTQLRSTFDLLEDHAEKGHSAALGAVAGVAEAAATSGNRPVAEKARIQLTRIPVTTNAPFEAKRKEIMTRLPPPR